MTIAVLATEKANADFANNFALQCILHHHFPAQHYFICISDKKTSHNLELPEGPDNLHPFFSIENKQGKRIFFATELRWLIRKKKIDVLIHDGTSFYTGTGLKQLVVLKNGETISTKRIQRLQKYADCIVVHDEHTLNNLKKDLPEKKITLIPFGVSEKANTASLVEQTAYKVKRTGGSDYLLFFADGIKQDDLLVFLKAFSSFKKWNRTAMKLILVVEEKSRRMAETLINKYLYKDQIYFVDSLEVETNPMLFSSAYAAVFYDASNASLAKMMNALRLHVPLLLPSKPSLDSIFTNFATFYSNQPDQLSEKMSLLYKDETRKNSLVSNGALKAKDSLWPLVSSSFLKLVLATD
jgi:hypothetical protein